MSLKKAAKRVQKQGRRGDTVLAHISPAEAQLLKRLGGAGTRNPKTGLPEFYNAEYEEFLTQLAQGVEKGYDSNSTRSLEELKDSWRPFISEDYWKNTLKGVSPDKDAGLFSSIVNRLVHEKKENRSPAEWTSFLTGSFPTLFNQYMQTHGEPKDYAALPEDEKHPPPELPDSVRSMITDLKDQIGTAASEEDGVEATGLYKDLAEAQGDADSFFSQFLDPDSSTSTISTLTDLIAKQPDFPSKYETAFTGYQNKYTGVGGFQEQQQGLQNLMLNGDADLGLRGLIGINKDREALAGGYQTAANAYQAQTNALTGRMNSLYDQTGQATQSLADLAKKMGDQSQYFGLQGALYANQAEGIEADVQAQRDALSRHYAASGLNPNSPAYLSALMTTGQNANQAKRAARRNSALDSIGAMSTIFNNQNSALQGVLQGYNTQMGQLQGIGTQQNHAYNAQTNALDAKGNLYNTQQSSLNDVYNVKNQGLQFDMGLADNLYQGQLGSIGSQQNAFNTQVSGLTGLLNTGNSLWNNSQTQANNLQNNIWNAQSDILQTELSTWQAQQEQLSLQNGLGS